MAFIERFSQIVKGDMAFIGNTLGLSKSANKNNSGTIGSIGAFASLDSLEKVETFKNGTTINYLKNGSSATLTLPNHSEILYAELIWSGVYKNKAQDISKNLTKAIKFVTPKGEISVGADYKTKQSTLVNLGSLTLGIYSRSANVTQYVKKAMSGIYSVKEVPSIIDPIDDNGGKTNFAGWTLAVAYKNDLLSVKTLYLSVGLEQVYNTNGVNVLLPKFNLPKTGVKNAKLLFSVGEGDAEISGDSVLFGKDENSLIKLKGPNNLENNFFASQINNAYGEVDFSGSFGNDNHNAKTETNVVAGRQGWDITAISVKDVLENSQTGAVLKFVSTGDLYLPNAIGFAVDNTGANLRVVKCADKDKAVWGDIIQYSIEILNVGDIVTKSVALIDTLPMHLTFLEHSVEIDGVSHSGKFPIALSNLKPKEKHLITFKTRVDNECFKPVKNTANVNYSYTLPNGNIVRENCNSNVVCLISESANPNLEILKSVNKEVSSVGEILTYTNIVKNVGDSNVFNLYYFDNIPSETSFVSGSVEIDDVPKNGYDPTIGFNIKDLLIGESLKITFKVQIN